MQAADAQLVNISAERLENNKWQHCVLIYDMFSRPIDMYVSSRVIKKSEDNILSFLCKHMFDHHAPQQVSQTRIK